MFLLKRKSCGTEKQRQQRDHVSMCPELSRKTYFQKTAQPLFACCLGDTCPNHPSFWLAHTHTHTERPERGWSCCTGKPEGGEVLNLHWAASGSQTHCNKAAIFKSSHKILVIFVQGRCCPGRPHSCFLLRWWTWTCHNEWTFASRLSPQPLLNLPVCFNLASILW